MEEFELNNRSDEEKPKTVRWYNQSLGLFLNWLREEGMSTRLANLGQKETRHFIIHLQSRPGIKGPASPAQSTLDSEPSGRSSIGFPGRDTSILTG